MKIGLGVVAALVLAGAYVPQGPTEGHDVKLVNVSFPGPTKPKRVVDKVKNTYSNHFSTSASYKMEVEVDCKVPINTAVNVRTYAVVSGQRVSLGDARVGRAHSSGRVFVSFHIYPSSASFHGPCQFVCVVDADNEVAESDESKSSNEWAFQATIHPAGEPF